MKMSFSFKHMDSSKNLRAYAEEKAQRLSKYFHGNITLQWNFTQERVERIVHCHLLGREMDYFVEASTEDFIASIDLAIDKIEKQVRKHKEIVKDHLHKNAHKEPAA